MGMALFTSIYKYLQSTAKKKDEWVISLPPQSVFMESCQSEAVKHVLYEGLVGKVKG